MAPSHVSLAETMAPTKLLGAPIEAHLDRRGRARHAFGQQPQADFLVKPSFRAQRATVRDLSIRGVGLMWSRLLEPDTILAIRMQSASAAQAWMSPARVCHVTRLKNGIWVMGCRFPRHILESDVAGIIDDEIMAAAEEEGDAISDSELFAMLLHPAPGRE